MVEVMVTVRVHRIDWGNVQSQWQRWQSAAPRQLLWRPKPSVADDWRGHIGGSDPPAKLSWDSGLVNDRESGLTSAPGFFGQDGLDQHTLHHAVTCSQAPDVDVAIVRVPHEPVPSLLKLSVQFVEHYIRQQR